MAPLRLTKRAKVGRVFLAIVDFDRAPIPGALHERDRIWHPELHQLADHFKIIGGGKHEASVHQHFDLDPGANRDACNPDHNEATIVS